MKLTEAQLKRIIEEEVQRAIDEGLFDKIGGAIKGAGRYLGGKAAGAAKAAGSAVGRAAVAGADKLATATDVGLTALGQGIEDVVGAGVRGVAKGVEIGAKGAELAKKGVESVKAAAEKGAAEAEAASVTRQQRAAVEQAAGVVNNLGKMFDKIKSAPQGKQQIEDFVLTLARGAGIDLSALAASAKSGEEAGKKALASAPVSKRGFEGAGPASSRIGNISRPIGLEEQVDAITEAIMKRISKKR
jgi:hypothetical protein